MFIPHVRARLCSSRAPISSPVTTSSRPGRRSPRTHPGQRREVPRGSSHGRRGGATARPEWQMKQALAPPPITPLPPSLNLPSPPPRIASSLAPTEYHPIRMRAGIILRARGGMSRHNVPRSSDTRADAHTAYYMQTILVQLLDHDSGTFHTE